MSTPIFPQEASVAELDQQPGVNLQTFPETYDAIIGLRRFAIQCTASTQDGYEHPGHRIQVDSTQEPEVNEISDEVALIEQSGRVLVTALGNSLTRAKAVEGLLALESIRKRRPELDNLVSKGLYFNDLFGGSAIAEIVSNPTSGSVAIDALRLVTSRAATSESRSAMDQFDKHLPALIKVIGGEPKDTMTARLKSDVLDLLSHAAHEDMRFTRHTPFERVMENLGYDARDMLVAWRDAGKEDVVKWARYNIETILELENIEPGLSKKITETFNIKNFAKMSPKVMHRMYKDKMDHPEWPYFLTLTARHDHNGALEYEVLEKDLNKWQKHHHFRYEEHEVASIDDIRTVAQQAVGAAKEHGSLITDLYLNTHGSPSSLTLSSTNGSGSWQQAWERVLRQDNTLVLQGFRDALTSDARILVSGCSAGNESDGNVSIGRAASRITGRDTIAPKRNTSSHITRRRFGMKGQETPRMSLVYSATLEKYALVPLGTMMANNMFNHDNIPIAVASWGAYVTFWGRTVLGLKKEFNGE